jgi:hypothetical protein
MMNFKRFYINGSRFNIDIHIHPESYWNHLMYKLTQWTTKKKEKGELNLLFLFVVFYKFLH